MVGVGQVSDGLVRVAFEQIPAAAEDAVEVLANLRVGLLSLLMGVDRVACVVAGEHPCARDNEHQDHEHAEDRRGHAPLALPLERRGLDLGARRRASRHPVQEAVYGTAHHPVRRLAGMPRPALDRGHTIAHLIRERDRRTVRSSGERVAGPDRLERLRLDGCAHLTRLDGDHAVAPGDADSAAGQLAVDLFDRGLRVKLNDGVLDRRQTQTPGDVRGHEEQAVAHDYLAVPDFRVGQILRRQAAFRAHVGQRQKPGLANEVSLCRAERRDVELVASNHRDREPDRARLALPRHEPIVGVQEPLVCGSDRFLQTDRYAGRLVVVVLVANPFGDHAGCIAEAPPPGRRDQKVEIALGARRRSDARLDDEDGVGRVG